MVDAATLAVYRQVRRNQWQAWPYVSRDCLAIAALRVARSEMALRQAERDERIRFVWEDADAYNPYDTTDQRDIAELETRKIQAGEWEALTCRAEVHKTCPHCGQVIDDEWVQAGSLYGIVVDVDDKDGIKREVERDLAGEVGVL